MGADKDHFPVTLLPQRSITLISIGTRQIGIVTKEGKVSREAPLDEHPRENKEEARDYKTRYQVKRDDNGPEILFCPFPSKASR